MESSIDNASRRGRFRGRTEALIVAAQDGVVHTRTYRVRVLKEWDCASESCRLSAQETLGHILSSCPQHAQSLYKERHNRILYQVVRGYSWVIL